MKPYKLTKVCVGDYTPVDCTITEIFEWRYADKDEAVNRFKKETATAIELSTKGMGYIKCSYEITLYHFDEVISEAKF